MIQTPVTILSVAPQPCSPLVFQLHVAPSTPHKNLAALHWLIVILSLEHFKITFGFHIYVLAYGICFSLSDLHTDVEHGLEDTGRGKGNWDEVREWHGHIYTTKCKTDS